ncbi:NrdH-redoxin [Candidatus Marinamargulisbacteria bacterium SCGC AG-439-L15]|nr:NrdH-redoxin [Candidatus Marinamargulisbacteria bacterium SCGC AG-439-L15]
MKLIRNGLGSAIVLANATFKPKQLKRSEEEQATVDKACESLTLYQFHKCPFCVKVRREMTRLNITIELRNANENEDYRNELLTGGGKIKVPCLRIEKENAVTWMYESNDINTYLNEAFGVQA